MKSPRYSRRTAEFLSSIYAECNRQGRLKRDPLAVVAAYPDGKDRELAGLVASILAFGSVDLIMDAVRRALKPLGSRPRAALLKMDEAAINEAWGGFQYRYCFPADMTAIMRGARNVIADYNSIEGFFAEGDPGGTDVAAAASSFAQRFQKIAALRENDSAAVWGRVPGTVEMRRGPNNGASGKPAFRGNLLPDSARGSACKRLFLYLRWMAREDAVDLGGWKSLDPARLIVPLDVHMARVCSERLHFIDAPKADLKRALAATAAFRVYSPGDPVKYDFALTRPGIDPEPGDDRFGCR